MAVQAKRRPGTPQRAEPAQDADDRTVRPRIAWQRTSDVRITQANRPWRESLQLARNGGLQYWNTYADDYVQIDMHDQEFILGTDEHGNEERFWISWIDAGKWNWRTQYYPVRAG